MSTSYRIHFLLCVLRCVDEKVIRAPSNVSILGFSPRNIFIQKKFRIAFSTTHFDKKKRSISNISYQIFNYKKLHHMSGAFSPFIKIRVELTNAFSLHFDMNGRTCNYQLHFPSFIKDREIHN